MEVTREVVLEAPLEEVWSALTEPERLEEWFANDVELELEPGGEGVFRWDDGEERHAVVEEVDRERRFAFTWDEGHVSIELDEVDGGTRVVVTETAGAGWSTALSLRALVRPRLTDVFAALADPTRRHLLEALAAGRRPSTQLAAELPVTRQAVSKHLAALREAGLVTPRRSGRETLYRLKAAPLDEAVAWIVRVGGEWDARLERLRGTRTIARVPEVLSCALEVAPLHAEPDASSEQVTQALRGEPLTVAERRDGWASVTTAYGYPGWVADDALAEEPAGDVAAARPRRRSGRRGARLSRHAVPLGRDERARDRLLGARPHGVAAARPARAAGRRPAGGSGRRGGRPALRRPRHLRPRSDDAHRVLGRRRANPARRGRPFRGRGGGAGGAAADPPGFRQARSLGRCTSFELKAGVRTADTGAVDAAERKEILTRYMDHSRRFEAAAARRSPNGKAEVIPFAAPMRELEQEPTMREIEVLQLVADGLVNREIGQRLFLSEETVKSHVRHLLAKLQARSRAHAVAVGYRRGIIA